MANFGLFFAKVSSQIARKQNESEGLKLSFNDGIVNLTNSFDVTENCVSLPKRRSTAGSLETGGKLEEQELGEIGEIRGAGMALW